MNEKLRCYWCGKDDVHLGAACPGCGERLEVLAPVNGRSPLSDIYVRAYKEMVLAEDARVFAILDSIIDGGEECSATSSG
jgi:hypothetical protein